jgi:hypothetical protein
MDQIRGSLLGASCVSIGVVWRGCVSVKHIITHTKNLLVRGAAASTLSLREGLPQNASKGLAEVTEDVGPPVATVGLVGLAL